MVHLDFFIYFCFLMQSGYVILFLLSFGLLGTAQVLFPPPNRLLFLFYCVPNRLGFIYLFIFISSFLSLKNHAMGYVCLMLMAEIELKVKREEAMLSKNFINYLSLFLKQ